MPLLAPPHKMIAADNRHSPSPADKKCTENELEPLSVSVEQPVHDLSPPSHHELHPSTSPTIQTLPTSNSAILDNFETRLNFLKPNDDEGKQNLIGKLEKDLCWVRYLTADLHESILMLEHHPSHALRQGGDPIPTTRSPLNNGFYTDSSDDHHDQSGLQVSVYDLDDSDSDDDRDDDRDDDISFFLNDPAPQAPGHRVFDNNGPLDKQFFSSGLVGVPLFWEGADMGYDLLGM